MKTKEEIAEWIRAQIPDEDDCLDDEDNCFKKHPIHLAFETENVCYTIYADVEGMSEMLANWLQTEEYKTSVRC